MDVPLDRRSFALGVGAALASCALGAAWTRGRVARVERERAAGLWVVDREGHALHALDRRLLLVRSVPVARPVRLAVARDGAPWVARAPAGPDEPHVLERVSALGARLAALPCAPVVALAADGEAGVVLAARGEGGAEGAVVVERIDARGARVRLAAPPGARALAVGARDVAVAGRGGLAFAVGADGAALPLAEHRVAGDAAALAPALGGGWWWLEAGPPARLLRLDRAFGVLAEAGDVPDGAAWLAHDAAADRCWSIDGAARRVACHDGAGRRLGAADIAGVDALGPGAVVDGRLHVAAAGALVVLDAACRTRASQGGFGWLADVAARPP